MATRTSWRTASRGEIPNSQWADWIAEESGNVSAALTWARNNNYVGASAVLAEALWERRLRALHTEVAGGNVNEGAQDDEQ